LTPSPRSHIFPPHPVRLTRGLQMKLLVLAAMLCSLTASGAAQESTVERKGDKPDLKWHLGLGQNQK
jgi:hypothetical protein